MTSQHDSLRIVVTSPELAKAKAQALARTAMTAEGELLEPFWGFPAGTHINAVWSEIEAAYGVPVELLQEEMEYVAI